MRPFTTLLVLATSTLSVLGAPTPEVNAKARASCPDVQVYFARGTTETPTLGTVVGPGFSRTLTAALTGKSVTFTGIAYSANIAGFLVGGDPGGATTMATSVTSTANSCPDTKIVISGYSQGAQVTHLAAGQLTSAIQDRVVAVVTFGDPDENTALPGVLESRRKTFCNVGDLICTGQPIVLAPHLTYGSDAAAAAAFVKTKV
ncbi:cutinase [Ephemerocybe angulata]|uniref:Cutinase n=1 Tax=Ephemerocybe angulata TaxID=980116 RepID=A0A8H6MBP3_9AGAR|nr:cutinase [Tulosesus angulatus]